MPASSRTSTPIPTRCVRMAVSLQTYTLQAVGVLAEYGDGVGLEQVDDADKLVDFIEVVHGVVVAYHLAQVAGAAADQAIILGPAEGQADGGQGRVADVEHIRVGLGAAPGKVVHAPFLVSA